MHDLLAENGLAQFYDLSRHPGVKVRPAAGAEQYSYLDNPAVQQGLLDFTDGKTSRVTFHIPAIHCVACVWLLENLFRLHPAVGASRVNFARRQVRISFAADRLRLSQLVQLLVSLGYEPQLTLGELEKTAPDATHKKQWLQVGIAAFAFGNIMLFSLPGYLGLDSLSGPLFRQVFGYLSLALALPVLLYSASDYWRSALTSLRRKWLTLDVPIAIGLAALYARSAFEIISGRGEGYLDSLAGLVFFLLCGRLFQQKTHERLAFDRDYKCFFPLSATRITPGGQESVPVSSLRVGDRLLLRQGELIPADATLVSGAGLIDYSFVSGEADPATKVSGDYLYAGGRQVGGSIEVRTVKPVSQSYLASLWGHETFRKERHDKLNTLTNRFSRWFTLVVIILAVAAGLFWVFSGDAGRGLKAFTSVLIVACPCALALSAPFALGTAQRWLAHIGVFLKDSQVIERLAETQAIVFDKTGTLTASGTSDVTFVPFGDRPLDSEDIRRIAMLARQSLHPHSLRIADFLCGSAQVTLNNNLMESSVAQPAPISGFREIPPPPFGSISGFREIPGSGLEGEIEGHQIRLGSHTWLSQLTLLPPHSHLPPGSAVWVTIDGQCRGAFVLSNPLRNEADSLLANLGRNYEVALLSGDNPRERERFEHLFPAEARMRFNQSPLEKLGFVRELQGSGKVAMMVGDGLNDAGALRQSDIGVAVMEKNGAFTPASDIIAGAENVARLPAILAFARQATTIVRLSFGLSALYNLVGITVAAAGVLSPIFCAVLMPVSSISVVLFACGATTWAARRSGFAA